MHLDAVSLERFEQRLSARQHVQRIQNQLVDEAGRQPFRRQGGWNRRHDQSRDLVARAISRTGVRHWRATRSSSATSGMLDDATLRLG